MARGLIPTVRDLARSAGRAIGGSHRPRPAGFRPFFAKITASSGAAPPYSYEWSALNPVGDEAGATDALRGYLFNLGEQPGRLDPDGTSSGITYPPVDDGTVVLVIGTFPLFTDSNAPWTDAENYAGLYCFDATLQPSREAC